MDDGIELRRYGAEDLEATVRMWVEVKRVAYPYLPLEQEYTFETNLAFFRDHLATRNEIWLAVDTPRIVGLLAIAESYVDRLYVATDCQRRGIGTRLLAKARELSPERLTLHTHQKNTQARSFYEGHGFRVVRFGVSPPPESEPDVEYGWDRG